LNKDTPIHDVLVPIERWGNANATSRSCQSVNPHREYTAVHFTNIPALSPSTLTVVVELVAHNTDGQCDGGREMHMSESKLPSTTGNPIVSHQSTSLIARRRSQNAAVGPIKVIDRRFHLTYIRDFATPSECARLILLAQDKLNRSTVTDSLGKEFVFAERTSNTFVVNATHNAHVADIYSRVALLTGQSTITNIEQFQVVRYVSSQAYGPHFDWFHLPHRRSVNAQRRYTIFVYLNDVSHGGETHFPEIQQSFQPRRGDALFWENCATEELCHLLSFHQAKPVIDEVKYGLNIWIDFD